MRFARLLNSQTRILIFAALALKVLTSCASAPDVLVCTEINMTKGWCTKTISNEEFFIDDAHPYSFTGKKEDEKTWWDLRPYMVLVPIASWAAIKSYIIKQCKQNNCNAYVKSWDRKIREIDGHAVKE